MAFPFDMASCLMAFGISAVGAVLQGSVGFGLGLIGVPLLVLIDPVFVPGPLLLAAFLLNLLMSYREHASIDFKGVKWAIPGRFLGAAGGAGVLSVIPRDQISMLFGTMVLLAVAISLAGLDLPPHPRNVLIAGTFSGFMGTTSAIGGPPVALVFQKQKGPRIRSTLSVIFAAGTVISMISLALIGRFGGREMLAAVFLFPGVVLGFFISRRTSKILDRGSIRMAVLAVSAFTGIFVILRNLL
jgi:uncharacterized membrane protein YfcA